MAASPREDDPFRRILRELIAQVPGARGAIFVDWEGESVELASAGDAGGEYDTKLAGAEVGLLLQRCVTAARESGVGRTRSLLVRTENVALFVQTLDEEYFVLLVAAASTHPGIARARLDLAVGELRRHL